MPTQPELAAILKQPAMPRWRLTAQQVRALPDQLPITVGRVHFIRQVNSEGDIELFNETWHVHKRLAGQCVWATDTTHPPILLETPKPFVENRQQEAPLSFSPPASPEGMTEQLKKARDRARKSRSA